MKLTDFIHAPNQKHAPHKKNCTADILKMICIFENLEKQQKLFSKAHLGAWNKDKNGTLSIDEDIAKTMPNLDNLNDPDFNFRVIPGYYPTLDPKPKSIEDIKKIHAYMLGIHLQQYLVKEAGLENDIRGIRHVYIDPELDFEQYSVFQGDLGQRFQALIQGLVHTNPSKRLSLNDAKNGLEWMQHSLKVNPYYKHSGALLDNRYLAYNASADQFSSLNNKYQDMHGDLLKTEILYNIKTRIENATTAEALEDLKRETLGGDEYKVLQQRQGLFAHFFSRSKLDTASTTAVQEMFDEREQELGNRQFCVS